MRVMSQINVSAGQNLQSAINSAQPGSLIVAEANASFSGLHELPDKGSDRPIIIRSSALADLPPDTRVTPEQAGKMPRLVATSVEGVLKTTPACRRYRFEGVNFFTDRFVYDLVRFGASAEQTSVEQVPHHLTLDRCLVHAADTIEAKRGVSLNSSDTDLLNCWIAGFKVKGQEAQAAGGWNGLGNYRIINCYLEGAGENFLYGGALPSIPNLIPTNLEIRRCHFAKPVSWRGQYTVKNILELKTFKNVIIDGNIFEYCWLDAQQGYSILFTARPNDSGSAAVIEDVEFTNNIVQHLAAGLHFLGQDNLYHADTCPRKIDPSNLSITCTCVLWKERRLRRVRVANNIWEIDGSPWGGDGCFVKMASGTEDVTIEHNTVFQTGNIIKSGGAPHTGFIYRSNISRHNDYGVHGDDAGYGNSALAKYFPGVVFTDNVIAKEINGPWNAETIYPADNYFPEKMADVGFVDIGAKNYRLNPTSPYNGKGADVNAIERAIGGKQTPPPPPPPPDPTLPPSPDGTRGVSIVDSAGAKWTFGVDRETLKNGVQVGRGSGVEYLYYKRTVYVKSVGGIWFKWSESEWIEIGNDPNPPSSGIRRVQWFESDITKNNQVIAALRAEKFYLKEIISQTQAEFEKTQ